MTGKHRQPGLSADPDVVQMLCKFGVKKNQVPDFQTLDFLKSRDYWTDGLHNRLLLRISETAWNPIKHSQNQEFFPLQVDRKSVLLLFGLMTLYQEMFWKFVQIRISLHKQFREKKVI